MGAAQGRCWLVTVNVRWGELVCVERIGVDWTDGSPREARRWGKVIILTQFFRILLSFPQSLQRHGSFHGQRGDGQGSRTDHGLSKGIPLHPNQSDAPDSGASSQFRFVIPSDDLIHHRQFPSTSSPTQPHETRFSVPALPSDSTTPTSPDPTRPVGSRRRLNATLNVKHLRPCQRKQPSDHRGIFAARLRCTVEPHPLHKQDTALVSASSRRLSQRPARVDGDVTNSRERQAGNAEFHIGRVPAATSRTRVGRGEHRVPRRMEGIRARRPTLSCAGWSSPAMFRRSFGCRRVGYLFSRRSRLPGSTPTIRGSV